MYEARNSTGREPCIFLRTCRTVRPCWSEACTATRIALMAYAVIVAASAAGTRIHHGEVTLAS